MKPVKISCAIAALCAVWGGPAAYADSGDLFPHTVTLKQQTSAYKYPDAAAGTALQIAPQDVYIGGQGDTDGRYTWYKIGTWRGERWARLAESEFYGQDELVSYDIALLEDAALYDEARSSARTETVLSPQTVHIEAVSGSYLKLHTWLGDKWIKSSPDTMLKVEKKESALELGAVTPIFAKPDPAAEVLMELAPQKVDVFEQAGDWAHIRTAGGGTAWVNPRIALPAHTEPIDEKLELSQRTVLYAYPSFAANGLGEAAPQTVEAFEKAGNWYHIHSDWLGDVWVYPLPGPDRYTPPAGAQPLATQTPWTYHKVEIGGSMGRTFPLSAELRFDVNPFGEVKAGTPMQWGVSLTNLSMNDVSLQAPAKLLVDIARVDGDGHEQVVWSTTLPVLNADFKGQGNYLIDHLQWDQTDSAGNPVPEGNYVAHVRAAEPVAFTEEGVDGTQKLTFDGFFSSWRFHIELPGMNKTPLGKTAESLFTGYLASLMHADVPDERRIADYNLHQILLEDETPQQFTFSVNYDVLPATSAYKVSSEWATSWQSQQDWVTGIRQHVRVSRDGDAPAIVGVSANP